MVQWWLAKLIVAGFEKIVKEGITNDYYFPGKYYM
jgi:hypothetical protein